MFPIWAITNLTARTNFPLEFGLFDLLIIDEASQCDIPSAIPLIYRAKKVVIIGDPNQLRHVALLRDGLDRILGKNTTSDLKLFHINQPHCMILARGVLVYIQDQFN